MPLALARVHRNISVPQQVFRLVTADSAERDTNACGDDDLAILENEGLRELVKDDVRDGQCVKLVAQVLEDDHELIAAEAGDGILRPETRE